MKIALIRRKFSATGGAELYLRRLVAALAAAGHQPYLFAQEWEEAPEGVQSVRVEGLGSRARAPLAFAEAVAAEIRRHRFDVIFSLERTISQDVYRAGDGVHRAWLEQRRRYAPWWRRWLVGRGAFHRNMMRLEERTFDPANTRHIIVNSNMVKQEIARHFAFPEGRIHLVRNGVDVCRFQGGDRAGLRRRFGLADGDFVMLFVGSGWVRKGLPYMLRLMARWEKQRPAVKLLVVGKGRHRGKLPANVIHAGSMTVVEDAYAGADLLTFVPIYEPSANVVSEALAARLPVITSRCNGACELITPGAHGEVIDDPADIDALEAAIAGWVERGQVRLDAGALPRPLDLETNVAETIRVLELAARERAGR